MMTRSRKGACSKASNLSRKPEDFKEPVQEDEIGRIASSISQDIEDVSCYGKQILQEHQHDQHECLLTDAVMGMSNELRLLSARMFDLETLLVNWVKAQTQKLDTIVENSFEDVILKSRSTQFEPPSASCTPSKSMFATYADALKSPPPLDKKVKSEETLGVQTEENGSALHRKAEDHSFNDVSRLDAEGTNEKQPKLQCLRIPSETSIITRMQSDYQRKCVCTSFG